MNVWLKVVLKCHDPRAISLDVKPQYLPMMSNKNDFYIRKGHVILIMRLKLAFHNKWWQDFDKLKVIFLWIDILSCCPSYSTFVQIRDLPWLFKIKVYLNMLIAFRISFLWKQIYPSIKVSQIKLSPHFPPFYCIYSPKFYFLSTTLFLLFCSKIASLKIKWQTMLNMVISQRTLNRSKKSTCLEIDEYNMQVWLKIQDFHKF